MSRIEWSPVWSVGDDLLDREHQGLIALINRLADPEALAEEGPKVWLDAIAELVLYAETHFRHEEERMGQIGFPGLEAHRTGHMRFRKQLATLASDAEGKGPKALPDLYTFLTAWLKSHVLEEDQRYVPYLEAKTG